MQMTLKTITGRTINLSEDELRSLASEDSSINNTVLGFKRIIASRYPEYPVASQKLIAEGKILNDAESINPGKYAPGMTTLHLVIKHPQPEEKGSYFVFCQNFYDGENPGKAGSIISLTPVAELTLEDDLGNLASMQKISKAWDRRVEKNAENQRAAAHKASAQAYFGIVFIPEKEMRVLSVASDMILAEEGRTINFTPVCYVLPGSDMALGAVDAVTNPKPELEELMRQFSEMARNIVDAALVEEEKAGAAAGSGNGGGGSKDMSNGNALFPEDDKQARKAPTKADVGCKCAIM